MTPPQGHAARRRDLVGAILAASLALPRFARAQSGISDVVIDGGPYVPTPDAVVARMLQLAGVGANDVVYDLGSGDGRLVIEAARRYGARGVGVEREARLVEIARSAAVSARVADRVSFLQGDLFETDLRGATVVTLYLLPSARATRAQAARGTCLRRAHRLARLSARNLAGRTHAGIRLAGEGGIDAFRANPALPVPGPRAGLAAGRG
jgi:SAM-dependent methyltransferase